MAVLGGGRGASTPTFCPALPQFFHRLLIIATDDTMFATLCGVAIHLCTKCTKFGQLILRKIIKIVATRCQILRLKCTKFNFGWGSAPDPAGGAYSAPPDPLAGLRGLLLRGGEGTGRGRERTGRGGVPRKGEGTRPTPSRPLIHISGYAPDGATHAPDAAAADAILHHFLHHSGAEA